VEVEVLLAAAVVAEAQVAAVHMLAAPVTVLLGKVTEVATLLTTGLSLV
jgi:hypothetical protein